MRFFALSLLASTCLLAQDTLLEIYTNNAFLTKRYSVGSGLFEATVPAFITNETLHVRTACEVKERTLGAPMSANTPLQERIATARGQVQSLAQEYAALEAKERLLERVSFTNASFGELQTNTQGFTTLFAQTLEAKEDKHKALQEAQKALDALLSKQLTDEVKPLKLLLTCNAPSTLELRFEVPNLEAKRLNTFTGESEEGRLAITQSLFLLHALGEDLVHTTLRLYSFGYNQNLAPIPFYPHYVGLPQPMMRTMLAAAPESSMDAKAQPQTLETKEIWEASGITLPSGERTQVVLNRQQLFGEYSVEIDGYGTAFAYVKGSFTPNTTVEAGTAQFVLDGMLLGERGTPKFLQGEAAQVYFGQHELVGVEKQLVRNFTTESGFGSTKTTQTLWKYTLTNRSLKLQNVTLLERLPLSSHEKVSIKRLGSTPTSIEEEGKVRWSLTLEPAEQRTVEFGYEQSEPIEK